jgi:hypothetical protein
LSYFLYLFSSLNLQAKVVGKVGYGVSFSGYDEYVPMVDKVVDAEWKKQASIQRPSVSKGQQVYSSVLLYHVYLPLICICPRPLLIMLLTML